MAKGFSMPSFSMPKVSLPTNYKLPKVNIGDIAAKADIPELNDMKSALNSFGVSSPTDAAKLMMGMDSSESFKIPTKDELRTKASEQIDKIKNIKPGDVIDAAKAKFDDVKGTINDVRENGVSALIPQEIKDTKKMMDDAGISFNFKGGDK